MSQPTIFKVGRRTYRLSSRWMSRDLGDWRKYNLLEVKFLWWWREVEREEIPRHAWISSACFGDTGGWTSALCRKVEAMKA